MIWLLWIVAWASATSFTGRLNPGQHASFSIVRDGETILTLHAKDGQNRQQYDWLRDEDPRSGTIKVTLPKLYLPTGQYTLLEEWPNSQRRRSVVPSTPTMEATIDTTTSATAVIGWSEGAVAWSPTQPGETLTIIGADDGMWEYWAVGAERPTSAMNNQRQLVLSLRAMISDQPTAASAPIPFWTIGLPLLLVVVFGVMLRRCRREWLWGGLCAAIVAYLATRGIWSDPFSIRLQANGPIYDPVDSMALMNHTWSGVQRASSFGTSFHWPTGSSWWTGGPAWFIYALGGLLAEWSTAIFAHNLLIALQYGLLGATGWAFGRSLGLRTPLALLAGVCAGLSPALLDEADAISLDRGAFFIAPLYLMCLHQALSRHHAKKWIVSAGLVLGLSIHAQVYYGVFLAVLSPLFVLWRLLLPHRKRTLVRGLIIAGIAVLVMTPALQALSNLSEGSYAVTTSADSLSALEQESFNRSLQRSLSSPSSFGQTNSAALNAAQSSLDGTEFLRPSEWLVGGSIYWLLLAGALLLARNVAVTIAILDVVVLMICALGPLLIVNGQWTGHLLPYALTWQLPGFSQLRNVHRFAYLAATISTIPIVLAMEHWLRRHTENRPIQWSWVLLLPLCWPLPKESMAVDHRGDQLQIPSDAVTMILPYQRIAPAWQGLLATINQLRVVNPPTFEQGEVALSLVETNGFINRLACLSGYTDICFADGKTTYYAEEAHNSGVEWIVVDTRRMPRQAEINALLAPLAEKIEERSEFAVWKIK